MIVKWLSRFVNNHRATVLRAALFDAIQQCGVCGGSGYRLLPGGRFTCPRCGYWRRVLRDTAHD